MTNNIIPIILAADSNYVNPMAATITSILENSSSERQYNIFILTHSPYEPETQQLLLSFNNSYKNLKLEFIYMKDKFNENNVKINIAHVTIATYYRLLIAQLLPDYEKCIYLDTDTIVMQDLTKLFDTDITDYYIAGVKACGYHKSAQWEQEYASKICLDNLDNYLNAGVLLFNLKMIRKNNLQNVFSDLSTKNFPCSDQDILNVACFQHILSLPCYYNVMTKYNLLEDDSYNITPGASVCFSKEEWEFSQINPYIIHYADSIKPWNNISIDFSYIWWKYALKSPFAEKIIENYVANIKKSYSESASKRNNISSGYEKTINTILNYITSTNNTFKIHELLIHELIIAEYNWKHQLYKTNLVKFQLETQKAERGAKIKTLEAQKAERGIKIKTLEAQKAERGITIKTLKTEKSERDIKIKDLEKLIKQKDKTINDLTNSKNFLSKKLKYSDKEINNLKNSSSYKIGRIITYIPREIKNLIKRLYHKY